MDFNIEQNKKLQDDIESEKTKKFLAHYHINRNHLVSNDFYFSEK
jgi:hypothetical protein